MTAIAISGVGLTGVLRLTWVQDNLAHVLDYSQADETSGTWTGLACPGHGLALGTDVENASDRADSYGCVKGPAGCGGTAIKAGLLEEYVTGTPAD
jgi:hypothetical protein